MNAVSLPRPQPLDPPEPYDGMPVSEADYWEFYYLGPEVTYEWNNGILEEKGVSDYLTFQVFDWFIQLLIEYLRTNPIANRVGLEMGFRLRLPNKVAIRRPDYGLVLHDNPAPLEGPVQSYRGIFDICIEGVSTSTKAMQQRDTVVKKVEYAAGGVREYYLLHHSPKLRNFYRLNERGVYEPMPIDPGRIVSSEVLPGFRWRLDDLERKPPLETLMTDPVYQDFVLVNYQRELAKAAQAETKAAQAETKAAQAETRAAQAETKAAQESARAERLAERLRALGIAPEEC